MHKPTMRNASLFQKVALALAFAKTPQREAALSRHARRAIKVTQGPLPYVPVGLVDPAAHKHEDKTPVAWSRVNIEGAIPSRKGRPARVVWPGQRCTCGALAALSPALRVADKVRRKAVRKALLRRASLVHRAMHSKRAATRDRALDALLAVRP